MSNNDEMRIRDVLHNIPEGMVNAVIHTFDNGESLYTTQQFSGRTSGKGILKLFHLYPGLELAFFCFAANNVSIHHGSDNNVIEVNYCQSGRVGWDMKNNISVYLGAGDMAIHTLDCCTDSTLTFPLGYYEGISVSIDFSRFPNNLPELLREANINFDTLHTLYCCKEKSTVYLSQPEIEHIFSPLSNLSDNLLIPYSKLKVQELILLLSDIKITEDEHEYHYPSQQVDSVKEIQEYLTKHLNERFTIEDLAKRYLINTTSLKTVFKAVYGMPLASYMKDYRIRKAAELLLSTNYSVAEIAKTVGYETQGKFSQAFKEIIGVLPTVYRKQRK